MQYLQRAFVSVHASDTPAEMSCWQLLGLATAAQQVSCHLRVQPRCQAALLTGTRCVTGEAGTQCHPCQTQYGWVPPAQSP